MNGKSESIECKFDARLTKAKLLKQEKNSNIDKYINEVYFIGYVNLINKLTRITETTATILDHIYNNMTNNIVNSGILIFDISDHLPIFCTSSPYNKQHKKLMRYEKFWNRSISK